MDYYPTEEEEFELMYSDELELLRELEGYCLFFNFSRLYAPTLKLLSL